MADDLVIVPSDGDGYTELTRTKTGRLFRKHLLNLGPLRHPKSGDVINVDQKFVETMQKNFQNGVCDIVQVPLANAKNEHSEDPERNIGEVVDIQLQGDKVYAVLDVRDPAHADKLGKTYLGASAMMHLDYTDTRTGEKVGPTLLHSCVTNRPYVTGLDNYEEILAATSDRSEDAAVLLSDDTVVIEKPDNEEKEMADEAKTETPAKPSLDELIAALKADHGIDVSALQAKVTEGQAETTKAAELSQTLVDALSKAGVVKLSNTDDEVKTDTVVLAVQELATNNVTLTNRVNKLEKQDAQHAVDGLVSEGRILPAQAEVMVELKLSNPTMFDALVPAQPIVAMSNTVGKTAPKDADHKADMDKEIGRLVELANSRR
jgi:hypothetical protein